MKKIIILMIGAIFIVASIQFVFAHRIDKNNSISENGKEYYHHRHQEGGMYCSRTGYGLHHHRKFHKSEGDHNNVEHHRKNEEKVSNGSRN